MSVVKISNEAYTEFKEFLKQNNINDFKIRITLAGIGWGGPVFNIVLDEQKKDDDVTKINDVTFFVDKQLIRDYEGFVLLSNKENNGKGLSLKPLLNVGGSCSTCSSCH